MKYSAILPAALALAVGAAGLAHAQSTSNGMSTNTANPPSTTATPTPMAPTATPGTPMTTPSTGATAPSAMAPNGVTQPNGAPIVSGTGSATNNAVNTKQQNNPGAPVAGANSFTQGEARHRIENHGYRQVTDLKLDRQGIWRGKAHKDGKTVNVSMDYQGNVVSQ